MPLTASGKEVIRYDDLLDGRPISYDWPDLDEKSAAAMCYTSGTTGNPKGVVYSHRSSYLHSMAVCAANNIGLVDGDRVLPVVPMFHANAWGQPYAAVMAGADLLLPDRFLQAEPSCRDDRTCSGPRSPRRCRRSGTTCCSTCTPTPERTSRR